MNIIKEVIKFYQEIINKKDLMATLVIRDFKQRYTGTFLGVFWIYFQPFMYISVLYFVFTYGLRAHPRGDVPFVSYLVSGMIPWIYFSENFNGSSNTIKQFSYLVKKINMRLSILPIVKILSSLMSHLVLIVILFFIILTNGGHLSFYNLQLPYYIFSMAMLLFGIGLITSSVNLFLPDTAKFVNVITQFGFWLTPILWEISKIPEKYRWIIKINPMEYIISGYRNSLIYEKSVFLYPFQAMYFWILTLSFILIGVVVFRKLRPHFAEVV